MVAIILMAGHVGFQVQAVRPGDGMPGVAPLLGWLGPGKPRLCQVLLAIQGNDVTDGCRAQGERDSAHRQERVILTVKDVLMLKSEPDPHDGPRTQAKRQDDCRLSQTRSRLADLASTLAPLRALGSALNGPVVGPNGNHQPFATPVCLIGRCDHLGNGRQIRAVRYEQ